MANRAKLLQWTCSAVVLVMLVTPAMAKDGRTLWLCGETRCVLVERPAMDLIEAKAVVVPTIHRSVPMMPHGEAAARRIPVEQLIDMSLVTGVFQ